MTCYITSPPFKEVLLSPLKISQKKIACRFKLSENTPRGNILVGDNYLINIDDSKRNSSSPKHQKVSFPYLIPRKEKLFTEGDNIPNPQKYASIEIEKLTENKPKNLSIKFNRNSNFPNFTQSSYEQNSNRLKFRVLPSIKKRNRMLSLNKETPIDLYTGFNVCKNYDNHFLKVLAVNTIYENKISDNTKTNVNKKNDPTKIIVKNNDKKYGPEIQNITEGEEENKNQKNNLIIGSKYLDNDISPDVEIRNDYYKRLNACLQQMRNKPASLNKTQNMTKLQIHNLQLKNFKRRRLLKNKQLVANTLKEVLDSKNNCLQFIERFRKSFDEYDNWCAPENIENLYDK